MRKLEGGTPRDSFSLGRCFAGFAISRPMGSDEGARRPRQPDVICLNRLWTATAKSLHKRPAGDRPRGRANRGRDRMQTFFVQIKCALGRTYEVASALAELEIASEIYSTAGEFDILAKFYVERDVDIGHFVGQKVQTIPGIVDTRTIITFKAF